MAEFYPILRGGGNSAGEGGYQAAGGEGA